MAYSNTGNRNIIFMTDVFIGRWSALPAATFQLAIIVIITVMEYKIRFMSHRPWGMEYGS